jgi:hypothetical protein
MGSLAQAGMDAIAAKYAGWQPPSLLRAQREAEEREAARLKQTIADAQAAIQTSFGAALEASNQLAALGTAPPPGMDPEEWQRQVDEAKAVIAKAGEDIKAAQATLDDALFQQRQEMLRKKAVQEQAEHDASVKREQDSWLAKLRVILREGKNVNVQVMKLLKSFDIDYLLAGEAWGDALAAGLRAALQNVKNAANELAQAVANRMKPGGSPAKEGPLSKFDMYDAGRAFGMDWAAGMASATKTASNAAGSVAGAVGGTFVGGGGGRVTEGMDWPDASHAGLAGWKPDWANRDLWEVAAGVATSLGKFRELFEGVQSGSIASNGRLLDLMSHNRTRYNWNDFGTFGHILDLMRAEGLTGREAAARFGLRLGGITTADGWKYLHANEAVIPLPTGGTRGRMGNTNITVNVHGVAATNADEFARQVAPAIERQFARMGRGQPLAFL